MNDTNTWELWFSIDKDYTHLKHALACDAHRASIRVVAQRVRVAQKPGTDVLCPYITKQSDLFEDSFVLCYLDVERESTKANWKQVVFGPFTKMQNYSNTEELTDEMFFEFREYVSAWWNTLVKEKKANEITKLFKRAISPGLSVKEAVIACVETELKPKPITKHV